GVDKNTTVVFPAPLMSTIGELGSFLARETQAAGLPPTPHPVEPAKTVHAAGSNNKPSALPQHD
ncbi:slipin family protein, partial [Streptomyces sp. NPDC006711]